MRPLLLDLFCCAGGAAQGYHEAGFDVVGIDIEPQPRYPFTFFEADALSTMEWLLVGGRIAANGESGGYWLRDFAGIHASPPCQAYSDLQKRTGREYPELIDPTREALEASGLPWVIENVEGAPLRNAVRLCGTMFPGLRVLRHRLFEANFHIEEPEHGPHPLVFTYDKRKSHYGKLDQDVSFVQVAGGGNCTLANARDAMGIDWMTKAERIEAIPPAYTRHVGAALLSDIELREAA